MNAGFLLVGVLFYCDDRDRPRSKRPPFVARS
jgi:hypothetical protein